MNTLGIKTGLILILMIAFLIMAMNTNDEIDSHLFASLAIITGTLTLKNLSIKNHIEND